MRIQSSGPTAPRAYPASVVSTTKKETSGLVRATYAMARDGAETGMARVFIEFLRREILRRYAPQNDKKPAVRYVCDVLTKSRSLARPAGTSGLNLACAAGAGS